MVQAQLEIPESQQLISHMERLFEAQRQAYRQNPMPRAAERIEKLRRLKQVLLNHQESLKDALIADFGCRARDETTLAEILPSIQGINYAIKHVKRWMKPSRRHVGLLFQPASAKVVYQPLGVVGIIVPWNYPIFLALGPLTSALSAGNRALIKLSEFTPHTNRVLKELLAEAFTEEEVAVVTGEADVAAAFSALPFDHLLFTGSTAVGRHVMRAAADNLTPVTLELGGKSPAIIDADIPMREALERLGFGKALNAGQTCVAPDYVLCPSQRVDELVASFREVYETFYPTLRDNEQYTSVVNERQYQRLQGYLTDARAKGAEIIDLNPAGEELHQGTRKMPLHLVLNVTDEMRVMQEEIFGPILPIVPYDNFNQALDYINDRPRPLALYLFSYDKCLQAQTLRLTHSGGVCLNDAVFHVAQDDMPFGGIGSSGIGHYHGKEGFLAMSHAKAVLKKGRLNSAKLAYPPYDGWVHKLIYRLFIR